MCESGLFAIGCIQFLMNLGVRLRRRSKRCGDLETCSCGVGPLGGGGGTCGFVDTWR
jgi:hypothetical protein